MERNRGRVHSTCSDTCSASPTCTGVSPAPTTPEPDPRLCSQAAQLPHARATLNFQGHWQGTACPYICPVGPTRTSEYATVLLTCGCAARLNELRLQSGQSPPAFVQLLQEASAGRVTDTSGNLAQGPAN